MKKIIKETVKEYVDDKLVKETIRETITEEIETQSVYKTNLNPPYSLPSTCTTCDSNRAVKITI